MYIISKLLSKLNSKTNAPKALARAQAPVDDVEDQKLVEVEFRVHCDFGSEGILFRKRK